jgi:putative (di)nucleoside polyphosphate hydrolase
MRSEKLKKIPDSYSDNGSMRVGVGVVLVKKGSKKIFAGSRFGFDRRVVSWFLNKPWQMPQGGLEDGELPEEAVKRELLEEIGSNNIEIIGETEQWIEYTIPPKLRRRKSDVVGQRQKWFLAKFNGRDSDINLNFSSHPEFDIWKWMSKSNIIRLAVYFKKDMYLKIFKDFEWFFK